MINLKEGHLLSVLSLLALPLLHGDHNYRLDGREGHSSLPQNYLEHSGVVESVLAKNLTKTDPLSTRPATSFMDADCSSFRHCEELDDQRLCLLSFLLYRCNQRSGANLLGCALG